LGNFVGQFAGPLVVGYAKSVSNDYFLSLLVLGICAILGGCSILFAQTSNERKGIQRGFEQPAASH
jgi:hypothetical protein